ncbi:MAG TPA: SH3 domain-containing protein [Methyloceanibacter sp.]|nr:SH3 domain-containing protein [Methyloceanibacter sp.]
MAVCAIALGVVWTVLSPAPVATPKEETPVKRSLAYEQAISQPREDPIQKDKGSETADAETEGDIPAFETVTSEAPDATGDPAAIQDIPADGDAPQDLAALPDGSVGTDDAEQWGDERRPPDPYAGQADPYGPPPANRYSREDDPYWQPPGDPYREDETYDPNAADPFADQRDPYAGQRDVYGGQRDPYAAQGDPYAAQRDPNAPPPQAGPWGDQNTEQWVEVIISGAPMRSTASEEAPMLFAFPYGRSLKVVSRNEGWVEVTDPKSSATGWMQAHVVAPSRAPGQQPYGQNEAYYEEQPRQKRGIFGGNGGFADMINRALGGRN